MLDEKQRKILSGLKGLDRIHYKQLLFSYAYGKIGTLHELNKYCFSTDYSRTNLNYKLLLL